MKKPNILKPRKNAALQFKRHRKDLLDKYGNVPFDARTSVHTVCSSTGLYGLGEMRYQLTPAHTDLVDAFEKIAEAMKIVHVDPKRWKYLKPGRIDSMQLDTWYSRSCTVSFRHRIDDGIIRVAFSQEHLELSIPHPRLWRESGLRWLASYTYCCTRNFENPTPWLGPSCGCERRIYLTALAEVRRRAAARSITTNTHTFCSHD